MTVSLLSLKALYRLCALLSPICYQCIPKYRKRALSNLKLAKDLHFSDQQIELTAKKSLFHLLLTVLEYGKLYRVSSLNSFTQAVNNTYTDKLLDAHQGVVFLCGHQSNWELLFLDATSRHRGVCIGKPIKNKKLYELILTIRQKFKGKVVIPKDAYKGCMKALRAGELVGVVGDQGLPESSFSYPCLGRMAYATTLPALLALRSNCPLVVATIIRGYGTYSITYSDPIEETSLELLTLKSLQYLDDKIKEHPEQWMWQHNRWKIPYADFIPKKYRHDALCVIVPQNNPGFHKELEALKELYKGAYLIVMLPENERLPFSVDEIITYKTPQDCFIKHYGPKLLFDGVGINGLERHFKNQAVFEYLYTPSLFKLIKTWEESYAH